MILKLDLNYDCGEVKISQDMTVTNNKVTVPKEVIGEDGKITIGAKEIGTTSDKYCLFRKDLPYPLQIFTFEESGKLEYIDSTIEQGQTYGYGLYIKENPEIWDETSDPSFCDVDWDFITADFEDIFLSDKDHTLCIKYNPQVSSFKTTIAEQKIETIGSKFPFFFRNGNLGYKEIPLGGLITYQADNLMLFDPTLKNEYYPQELGRAATKDNSSFVNRTLRDEFYLERKYKRKIEEWLNNGQPKLLRTAAEGNFIVRLMNVSLAPMDQLGRRLHSFTATAYEIADFKQEELIKNSFISFNGKGEVGIINENGDTLLPLQDYTGLVVRGDLDSSMLIKNTQKDCVGLIEFSEAETDDEKILIYNGQTRDTNTGYELEHGPFEISLKCFPDRSINTNFTIYKQLPQKTQSLILKEKVTFQPVEGYGAIILFTLIKDIEEDDKKVVYYRLENDDDTTEIELTQSEPSFQFIHSGTEEYTRLFLWAEENGIIELKIETASAEAEQE